ncbi:tetratricopeptide repeat protein [soil metagenome]
MTDPVASKPRSELPTELPAEMSLEEALVFGTRLHRLGQLDQAEEVYRAVLAIAPEHADALQFMGILRYARGHRPEGIALMQQSIALAPMAPGLHLNLGNMLLDSGRPDGATEAYERAAVLGEPSAALMNNLGVLRRHQQRLPEAEAAYRQAAQIDPEFIDAYNNLGNLLASQGQHEAALEQYCKALEMQPNSPATRRLAALALCILGRADAAARIYREWLADEPDNPLPQHYLAACTGEGVPQRASDAYVEATFDAFADSFDAKLEQLTYRAPGLVAQAVADIAATASGEGRPVEFDILDAGCGTGLCGPLLAPHSKRLVGVDLSAGMLAKARLRGVYDELVKAELVADLRARPAAFDVIVSADTLCYFGPLEEAAQAAFDALRGTGHLVFTVAALRTSESSAADAGSSPPGYRLNHHGRYSHSRPYIERTLLAAGFDLPTFASAILRREAGRSVEGFVVTAHRPGVTG